MKQDILTIEVLADGTIKTTSDAVSGANHATAEAFLRQMATLAGGETTRTKRKDAHAHSHSHTHSHDHNHDHDHQ